MNKHLHRIIFNAARGQRMVVAETASSHTGTTSGDTSRGARSFMARLTDIGLAVGFVAGLSLLFLAPMVANAQVIADPSAAGNQRPTVLQTANGVIQVNIQTPSAAGVSRNVYQRFDVPTGGVILNNVRSNAAQTTIGGMVAANPWIAAGAARVILNEVNSSNPSYLNGPTEVAGQRAEVIVANPSGIRVNGGTFLNASGVTLTTGTPVLSSGNLEAFRVTQGSVVVEGLGLDTRTADATRILARAAEINAGLWANHLTAVTGANEVKALASGAAATATPITGTGAAPSFMLDVAAIGGMYSGHIYLVGTEAGLGVNNRGALSAQQGEMVLLANGQLVNQGTIQAKGAQLLAAIDAPAVAQAKRLNAFVASWYGQVGRAAKSGREKQAVPYKEPYWHGYHLIEGGYFGYWCLEAVAAVKAFGLDDSLCVGHPHYPGDLLRPGVVTPPDMSRLEPELAAAIGKPPAPNPFAEPVELSTWQALKLVIKSKFRS